MATIGGYFIWPLPDLSCPEPSEAIAFNTLENDLADGYYSGVLFGSNNGLRTFKVGLPTLASREVLPNLVTGISGESLSREEAIWELYCETMVTGEPFAYPSPRTGQYYLVRFTDEQLDYQRMKVKIYSTGVTLKQVRQSGVTIFEPGLLTQTWGSFDPANFPGPLGLRWSDDSPHVNHFQDLTGDVVAGTSGSLPIVQFNLTTNNGFLSSTGNSVTAKEIFILMKMREATFSNDAGILSASATTLALAGATGTTKFFNLGLGAPLTYELNGVSYVESNMQAPMNAWGIVRWRHTTGITMANFQMGKDRNFAGRFAEMDCAYLIVADSLFPRVVVREIYEFLNILKAKL